MSHIIKLFLFVTLGCIACQTPSETSPDGDIVDNDAGDTDTSEHDSDDEDSDETIIDDADPDETRDADDEEFQDADPDGESDADQDMDWDRDGSLYCEFANGERINECTECLPGDFDTVVLDALATIFPNADNIEAVIDGGETHFIAELDSEVLGYAFLTSSYGFYGDITSLTGIDFDRMSIRTHVTEYFMYEWIDFLDRSFYEQFRCIDLNEVDIKTRDWGSYTVDAVSGATYTSEAVIQNVWLSFDRFTDLDAHATPHPL